MGGKLAGSSKLSTKSQARHTSLSAQLLALYALKRGGSSQSEEACLSSACPSNRADSPSLPREEGRGPDKIFAGWTLKRYPTLNTTF